MTTTVGADLVLPLGTLNRESLPVAGGKGANLGELISAGVPVPDGFVVTTAAYATAVGQAGTDPTAAAQHQAVAAAEVPTPVREAIVAAYHDLGGGAVAVRSSGTAEDLADAAFAGQHDTYLNIVGEDAVIDAVRRCWASLWTDRAIDYRRDRHIDTSGIAIAVVVQRMAQSTAAGVMFTADPVSGRRDRVVIDASPGLGEAVVSGLVTPDHYVVQRKNGRRLETSVGRREVVIRSREGGGTSQQAEAEAAAPVLDDAAVRRLTAIGRDIEAHFGEPQDIEWSYVDGEMFIVQARPVTALPDVIGKVGPRKRLLSVILSEIVTSRPYPMDVTAWTRVLFSGVRVFASSMGARFPRLEEMLETESGVYTRLRPQGPRPYAAMPFILARNVWRSRHLKVSEWESDPRLRQLIDTCERLKTIEPRELPYGRLPEMLDEACGMIAPAMAIRYDYLPRTVLAVLRFRLTLARLRYGDLFNPLLAGADTKTDKMNRDLEELATLIRDTPSLRELFDSTAPDEIAAQLPTTTQGDDFAARFWRLLDRYGHREIGSIAMISQPTWKHSPQTVLQILHGMAQASGDPIESHSAAAEARLFAHPRLRRPQARERVRRRLEAARWFTRFREDTHFYFVLPQPIVRDLVMEYGRRLSEAGVLDEPDEVFHLHREELPRTCPPGPEEARRLRTLVDTRKAIRNRLESVPFIDPRYIAEPVADTDALTSGMASAAGQATGPARIVRGPQDFARLREGEILVAPFTNPTWTPLFSRAAGVVVDAGGPMSHAAIVAREYGIPAVLGTGDATRVITDGQRVTVDGSTGTVSEAPPA